ncbi:hypothetical protein ACFLTA_07550 [Bacteroidota bacterium]
MIKKGFTFSIILILLYCFLPEWQLIRAQETEPGILADSLLKRILELEHSVQELENYSLEKKQEDEMQNLMEQASRLSEQEEEKKIDVSKKYFSGVRQQQGLNPNISFGVDFFGGISTSDAKSISEPENLNYGSNGIHLREAQVSFIAPLDPFARGKGFLSATPDGFFVDEAYLEWLNLPLNATLKTGIFKTEFGFLNRYHDHALPQFDKPRALVNLFETGGLGGPGISPNFMLPAVIAHATSLDLAVIYSSSPQSFRPDSAKDFIFTGQFLNYYDLSANSYLEVRLSGAAGKNAHPGGNYYSYVGSAGVAYKWTPVGREKYRTLEWKTEFLYSKQEYNAGDYKSIGFYSSIQNKLNARFWLSGRVGYSEIPYDPSQHEWDFTLAIDFWQSEFVLTRFQYQYNDRNITYRYDLTGPFPSDHSFVIQVVWAMGPHKHEAY